MKDGGLWPATGKFSRHNRMGNRSRPISETLPSARRQNRIPKSLFWQDWFLKCSQENAAWRLRRAPSEAIPATPLLPCILLYGQAPSRLAYGRERWIEIAEPPIATLFS